MSSAADDHVLFANVSSKPIVQEGGGDDDDDEDEGGGQPISTTQGDHSWQHWSTYFRPTQC